MSTRDPLFFVALGVFPLGILLMTLNPMYYFVGIGASFLAVIIQSPRGLYSYEKQVEKNTQAQLKWTMLIVGSYLLSGFVALIFF